MDFQMFNQCCILRETKINRLCCVILCIYRCSLCFILNTFYCYLFKCTVFSCCPNTSFILSTLSSDTIVFISVRSSWVYFRISMALLNFRTHKTQLFQVFYCLCLQFLKSMPLLPQFLFSREF